MRWLQKFSFFLIAAVAFILPIEHKYDKPLRHLAASWIPKDVDLSGGFDTNIYFYPSDVIGLFLLVSLLFVYRVSLRSLFLEKGMVFLWLILICALTSLLSSPLAHYPTVYTRLLQWLTPILIVAFLINTPSSARRVEICFSLLIAAAFFQSLIAISQYFSQEYLGLRMLSECRDPPSTLHMPSGRISLFDFFSEAPKTATVIRRSAGTFPHTNVLGGFLMLGILSLYSFLLSAKTVWKKGSLALLLMVLFLGLATTYSRSAIFGLALGTILWFVWAAKKKLQYRFALSLVAASTLFSFGLLSEQYLERGGIFNYTQAARESDNIRLAAQQTALKMIQDAPIKGVGFEQFSKAASSYGNPTGVHNIYLFLSSEMGIAATLAFLGFVGFVLLKASQVPWTAQMASLIASLFAFLFIGGCDFYPILFHQGKLMLFLVASLLLSEALRIAPHAEKQMDPTTL